MEFVMKRLDYRFSYGRLLLQIECALPEQQHWTLEDFGQQMKSGRLREVSS